ncbi:hypothetical protein [Lacinutrix algicola]|uniref:hypothetical protein n=1 Tax=Lacinutrix algicola TaxID=342954 RepID=UPI0006E2359E|nr:hypothetical protein [Lacinutrix algicola]
MKLKYIFTLFILVVIAQLFVPMQMIFGQEAVLNNGKAYKFRTQFNVLHYKMIKHKKLVYQIGLPNISIFK